MNKNRFLRKIQRGINPEAPKTSEGKVIMFILKPLIAAAAIVAIVIASTFLTYYFLDNDKSTSNWLVVRYNSENEVLQSIYLTDVNLVDNGNKDIVFYSNKDDQYSFDEDFEFHFIPNPSTKLVEDINKRQQKYLGRK